MRQAGESAEEAAVYSDLDLGERLGWRQHTCIWKASVRRWVLEPWRTLKSPGGKVKPDGRPGSRNEPWGAPVLKHRVEEGEPAKEAKERRLEVWEEREMVTVPCLPGPTRLCKRVASTLSSSAVPDSSCECLASGQDQVFLGVGAGCSLLPGWLLLYIISVNRSRKCVLFFKKAS